VRLRVSWRAFRFRTLTHSASVTANLRHRAYPTTVMIAAGTQTYLPVRTRVIWLVRSNSTKILRAPILTRFRFSNNIRGHYRHALCFAFSTHCPLASLSGTSPRLVAASARRGGGRSRGSVCHTGPCHLKATEASRMFYLFSVDRALSARSVQVLLRRTQQCPPKDAFPREG